MTWMRPVEARISDSFDAHRNRPKPSVNPGTDYITAVGVPCVAIADGIVARIVTTIAGAGGRMIFLDFPSGHKADYLHMSRIDVVAGQAVKKGQVIGLSGASGLGKENGYGPHLHLSFRMGGNHTNGAGNIDFEAFLGGSPAPAPVASAPAPSGSRPTLRRGAPAGPDVLYLQNKLGVNPTGPFGPKTHAAVVAFQQSKGLTPDGIVGPRTWSAIG
jgi:murein DD-endopeptidase MepM/ murein hydrolase activator NlpD